MLCQEKYRFSGFSERGHGMGDFLEEATFVVRREESERNGSKRRVGNKVEEKESMAY